MFGHAPPQPQPPASAAVINPFAGMSAAVAPAAPAAAANPFLAMASGGGPPKNPFQTAGVSGDKPGVVQPTPTGQSSPFTQLPAASNAAPSFSFAAASAQPSPFAQMASAPQPSPFAGMQKATQPTAQAVPNPFSAQAKPAAQTIPAPSPFAHAKPMAHLSPFAAQPSQPAQSIQSIQSTQPSPFAKSTPSFSKPTPSAPKPTSFTPKPTPFTSKPIVQTRVKGIPAVPNGPQTEYARKIYAQLDKDKIRPPRWPAEPGNPDKRSGMEAFRESYKKYRERVRESLIRAGLIDDPEVRKKLEEAIDFKGICEDMCPEFEKISRIVQYDVKMPEKTSPTAAGGASDDGTLWPSPPLMVKALARSAAGQEAPLPMDVRSVGALQRTLDYLVDTVLGDDSRLPTMHNFLWDRTRAIRRDFVFHSSMTDEEMRQQVYCLETITRFHATALHQLSRAGVAAEDFSEQQEREQLGKALLSLMQAYDDCRDRDLVCESEAEFRAYFLLLNAHDPDVQQKVAEMGRRLWQQSDDIQTAMTLVESMQSIWDWRGPLRPLMPATSALGAFHIFFRILENTRVSYTMACLAEIHHVHVRRGILRNVVRAYARTRDTPKDLTVTALNSMLCFDTDAEARDFVVQHGLQLSSDNVHDNSAHLLLDRQVHLSTPTVRQSFSHRFVERKRGQRSLPELIHTTIYEEGAPTPTAASTAASTVVSNSHVSNGLFVEQTPVSVESKGKEKEASTASPAAPSPFATAISTKPAAPAFLSSAPSIFTSTTTPSPFKSSQPQAAAPFKQEASLQPPNNPFTSAAAPKLEPKVPSTTPDGSPEESTIFGQKPAEPKTLPASALFQPQPQAGVTKATAKAPEPAAGASSFASLFPASAPKITLSPAPPLETKPALAAPTPTSVFGTNKTDENASKRKREAAPEDEEKPAPRPSPFSVGPPAATTTKNSAAAQPPSSFMSAAAAAPQNVAMDKPLFPAVEKAAAAVPVVDRMTRFNRWFTLGDQGLIDQFKEVLVEELVRDVIRQQKKEEEERLCREEDEQSWAEALKFKRYNLRVKFFYRWRDIARNSALNRHARERREQADAYRAAERAARRVAAEKAAVEEREKAAEARRAMSRPAKYLESLGYYGEFGTRKRKVTPPEENETETAEGEQGEQNGQTAQSDALLATGILRGVHNEHEAVKAVVHEASGDYSRGIGSGGDRFGKHTQTGNGNHIDHIDHINHINHIDHDRDHGHEHARPGTSGSIGSLRSIGSIGSIGSISSLRQRPRSISNVGDGGSNNTEKVYYRRTRVPGSFRSVFTRISAEEALRARQSSRSSVSSRTEQTDKTDKTDKTVKPHEFVKPDKPPTNFQYYKNKFLSWSSSLPVLPHSAAAGPRRHYYHRHSSSAAASPNPSDGGVDQSANPLRFTSLAHKKSLDSFGTFTNSFATEVASANGRNVQSEASPAGSPAPSPVPSPVPSFGRSTARSLPGSLPGSLSGSLPGSGSQMRSIHWPMRSRGLVRMPNGEYLHESLALPMLRENKRFRGIGNYGLPPVPPTPRPSGSDDGKRRSLDDSQDQNRTKRARTAQATGAANGNGHVTTTATSSTVDLAETERVIREMRELADSIDHDKEWFREQAELLRDTPAANE